MSIPVLREGMPVICVDQVNGLEHGGRYTIAEIKADDMFYGAKVVRVKGPSGAEPSGGRDGYFAWRFKPVAVAQ